MPRAAIPYFEIEQTLERMYPRPSNQNIVLIRPQRWNDVKAPTRVYDRSTGNYAPIGWKVTFRREIFFGFDEASVRPLYSERTETILILD